MLPPRRYLHLIITTQNTLAKLLLQQPQEQQEKVEIEYVRDSEVDTGLSEEFQKIFEHFAKPEELCADTGKKVYL